VFPQFGVAKKGPIVPRLEVQALRYLNCGPIDLQVAGGECVVVTGDSGSGKTLLLRAVADLDPHQGRIVLADIASYDCPAPEWRRRVGMLPTESQWWYDTVGEHFDLSLLADLRISPADIGLLHEVTAWQVSRMSAGERQRAALLRLLANQPEALLLDEPTASMDLACTIRVEELAISYCRRIEAPLIWVTHDVEQADRIADRRYTIADGRLIEQREARGTL
jgi:ABC-type iron transport system FetAB ATPase subunit